MHQVETVRQGMVNPRNNFTFSQLPIWRQILLLLGGSILLVGYAVGIVFEQLETDYLRQNLEEQNHRILSVLSATSIDAVISEDQARLETIITQLATLDPNILSLTMENERRETLAHWQRISDTGAMTHLAFAEDILFDGEHFGRIFIDWNIQPLQQQIDLHVLSMRLFSTAVLIALTGLILFWIYLLISKPINTLNKRLHMIAQGDLTSEVHISSGKELIRLADSVNTLSRILRINESRKKEIRQLAFFDKTTGLASRAHFLQRFSDTLKAATRRDEQLALIFLDLDGFKDINDSMGHETGDQLLAIIGQRLEKPLRDVDFAARFGGDEFCIIVDNITDEFDAAEVANRCLKEIHQPVDLGTQTVRPMASLGIALFPKDGSDMQQLLKAADSAMYAAKEAGKHRYAFYIPELTTQASQRLALEQQLRVAVDNNDFTLHYQPQISLSSGKVTGVEALIRWHHAELGDIPPSEFINLAERIGLIQEIGEWVLETACRQAASWHHDALDQLQVAVNISAIHFTDLDFVNMVTRVLNTTGIDPKRLEIEVTESVIQLGDNYSITCQQLDALGIKVAVDDFGTGYSSLAVLKQLPIDTLKVDRLFIKDLQHEAKSTVLVGTIIGMAQALGYKVVAEGAETLEQIQILRGLGCHQVQGYYFSPPVPADQIPSLVSKVHF